MPRRTSYDMYLFFTAGLLVVGGLLMVGSASHYAADRLGQSRHYFLIRQLVHLAIGAVVMLALMSVPYRELARRRYIVIALAVSVVSLLVVLAMPAAGGAHRWLHLGGLRLQPSEFAKIVAILFTAQLLARKEEQVDDFWAVPFPCLAVVVPLAFLIVIEPDLGSAMMMTVVVCVMIFAAGLRWRYVWGLGALGSLGLALGVVAQPYRVQRFREFLESGSDLTSLSWQLRQSYVALGSGGLTGVGFGQGHQKAHFLPEPHTDFIYSVVGEEFGLVGTLLVLVAFMLLFWRGLRAALRAPDRFGFYLALGLTFLVVLQALVNMGVCIGLFPTKGLALPFFSYGGSSLLATLAATGLLLNVSQHSS